MIARSVGASAGVEAVRVVRALGGHRYVAGRLHSIHALALASIEGAPDVVLDASAWARQVLAELGSAAASRDERLWRRCSDAELTAVVDAFWTPGDRARETHSGLRERLARLGMKMQDYTPFDEAFESTMHPILVDAGWELLTLTELDPMRHRGVLEAFDGAGAFEAALGEERSHVVPPLYELPALGPRELLDGVDLDGVLSEPLVVWTQGHETYLDYVVRGVRRAAKLPETDTER